MASRSFSKVLRAPLARQFVAPATSRGISVAALAGARAGLTGAIKASSCNSIQQIRGVKTIDFAGHKEKVFGKVSLQSEHPCKLTK